MDGCGGARRRASGAGGKIGGSAISVERGSGARLRCAHEPTFAEAPRPRDGGHARRVCHPGQLRRTLGDADRGGAGRQRGSDSLREVGRPRNAAGGGARRAGRLARLPAAEPLPLATSYRLVFIDERGSGRSPRLEDTKQYTVEKMVEDRGGACARPCSSARLRCSATPTAAWSCRHTPSSTRRTSATSCWPARSPAPASSTTLLGRSSRRCRRRGASGWRRSRRWVSSARVRPGSTAGTPTSTPSWPGASATSPRCTGARPDANYDPLEGNTKNSWELYREMWGSHGEFVVDGNLKEVEWVDRLSDDQGADAHPRGRPRRIGPGDVPRDEREDFRVEAGRPPRLRAHDLRGPAGPVRPGDPRLRPLSWRAHPPGRRRPVAPEVRASS